MTHCRTLHSNDHDCFCRANECPIPFWRFYEERFREIEFTLSTFKHRQVATWSQVPDAWLNPYPLLHREYVALKRRKLMFEVQSKFRKCLKLWLFRDCSMRNLLLSHLNGEGGWAYKKDLIRVLKVSKTTKLIFAWFTSTRGVYLLCWDRVAHPRVFLGLSVCLGQSQTALCRIKENPLTWSMNVSWHLYVACFLAYVLSTFLLV